MSQTKTRDVYMVIGGNGFLGRHIVQQLLDRGDIVSVFDIVERYNDVAFYAGDISNQESVASALRSSGTTCIIHTASPHATLNNPALFHKVNVEGTKAVIAAAVETKVRKLVFTSSAGVVFNGEDIMDADERLPFPDVPMDAYNDTKAQAERAVLEANGKGGLLTVALRPAGIFGPGDRQVMSGLYQVYERGQTHFQIGDNTNLFDWTYVGNVAYAHLLAADKLETPPPAPPVSQLEKPPAIADEVPPLNDAEIAILDYPILPVSLSTGQHRVPTCEARPLGPYVTPPPNAAKIAAAFEDPNFAATPRPVIRTRFDQLSDHALKRAKVNYPDIHPLQVAGQVFFITNGEPTYFWDFPRLIWNELDKYFPEKRKPRGLIKLPKSVGIAAATGSEWYGWLTGKDVTFTKFKVTFSCAMRWHNIEKARRILGYEPQVGVQEGAKRMVEWWYADYLANQKKSS
ncbi:Sterol-4-alpha-carboxylate 3-dehydrogenase, decarboxylating [Psilocybe cubensis]|uniref:Sterol-4-alpha-carboxylate 3-dehydrogenase, decarboxylating n=2 Tax=Psilocybe cubensis TaxID=181762 RepID=A0ACB8GXZ7_PSICU|nr:Sterol-4-alpha-carboxylate 3-dehydrogenase, decarboxylating [Psilocybe cubensis]KAH9480459.1 Sterol-4-alpha-carboxylate 3-dehydrogenase, decarboxylating [Psilocybe cubensis]